MNSFARVALTILIGFASPAQGADLSPYKSAGCSSKLHVVRPDVFLNGKAIGPYAALHDAKEGTLVGSADAGIQAAGANASGWHAHWEERLQTLRPGDSVAVGQDGVAHLSYPDGTIYDLPQGVTRLDPSLCHANTAPVVALNPGIPVGLAALAAAGVGIGVGISNSSNPSYPSYPSYPVSGF